MRLIFQIFTLLLCLLCVHVSYADNKVETGDIDTSEVQIFQEDQPSEEKPSPSHEVTTGKIEGSTVTIQQVSKPTSKDSESTPWWDHFFKEIIAGVIGLFFALLLWRLKSRWGSSGN